MDEIRARRIANELNDSLVGKFKISDLIDNGKSALVLIANFEGQEYVVKIFDPEMVERFGKDTQLKRIQRELIAKDTDCENLVKIIDGGECKSTGYLYVVMEYLQLPTLESVIKVIPRDKIRNIISQLANAAIHLELLGLCHRDIKPANIVITPDFDKIILLDLGVLKPIGYSDLTDNEAREFIGTLRYSSPEFLLRTEANSIEGWRAVTFYQIGAVLYDLIMKRPIFEEDSTPYAQLVKAILEKVPKVEASDVSADLISLAKSCLIKDPNTRLKLVKWENFSAAVPLTQSIESIRERIHKRNIAAMSDSVSRILSTTDHLNRLYYQVLKEMLDSVENIIRLCCTSNTDFPPVQISVISNQINIVFLPSITYQLNSVLYLVLNIDLLDVKTKGIKLSYWVAASTEEVVLPEVYKQFINLLEGAYEEEIVKTKIEELVYIAFDIAQQVNIGKDDKLVLLDLTI